MLLFSADQIIMGWGRLFYHLHLWLVGKLMILNGLKAIMFQWSQLKRPLDNESRF